MGQAGPTSQTFATPFPHKLGEIARSTDGDEFMFVEFGAAMFTGVLCQINDVYVATPLLGTNLTPARVGVVMTNAVSTDGGWVQIYGLHNAVQTGVVSDGGSSDQTVGYGLIPQASVGTPSGVLTLVLASSSVAQNYIYGMWLSLLSTVTDLTSVPANSAVSTSNASGPNSAEPATTSHIGNTYAVFLNYPYVTGVAIDDVNS